MNALAKKKLVTSLKKKEGIKMTYRFEDNNQNRIAGIYFTQVKYIPVEVKGALIKQGLWEDLQQELYADCLRYTCDVDRNRKYLRRKAQRCIYNFLKNYGFRKSREYKGLWIYPVKNIQNLKLMEEVNV